MSDLDRDLFEALELIDYTLSIKFVEKWRYKYSERFLKEFQKKLVTSLKKSKPLKLESLIRHFSNQKYSDELIQDFLRSIEIDLYYPFILNSRTF